MIGVQFENQVAVSLPKAVIIGRESLNQSHVLLTGLLGLAFALQRSGVSFPVLVARRIELQKMGE